ncbi:unnamed protein product [Strongylus vulgaris]|uniref:Uncharacterized protein n=1 Tax=Strongylus vulgaris TaxID=40348 RepID=A0A3P7IKH2_STRVU|nr:unnamed protein product [Strongylus vulgaris]
MRQSPWRVVRVLLVRNPWRPVQPDTGLDDMRRRRCDPCLARALPSVHYGQTYVDQGATSDWISQTVMLLAWPTLSWNRKIRGTGNVKLPLSLGDPAGE